MWPTWQEESPEAHPDRPRPVLTRASPAPGTDSTSRTWPEEGTDIHAAGSDARPLRKRMIPLLSQSLTLF
jgi:hypothetical protein